MKTSFKTSVEFINSCIKNSDDAFHNFEELLSLLENTTQRQVARKWLGKLISISQKEEYKNRNLNFSFIQLDISNRKEEKQPIWLLQLPSTFTPEEWSYTFFEGLSRYKKNDFQDKIITELGCGNGWITLAMAHRFSPAKIYGLDINPRAIICSRINLFINALDNQGNEIIDKEGKSLLDRVSFYESDLLNHFKGEKIQFDCIIGCIPQVLNPSIDVVEKMSIANNDAFLHSLSNYCGEQGYVEDQFGLGLIAKAIENGIDLIKPNGKIILNLGGRPGKLVLERLFKRRGFTLKKIWERKVVQANDTDIDSLVEIEQQSAHRFEFYMGLNSNEPISATTAKVFADCGGQISHTLSVYECTLLNHEQVKEIFKLIKNKAYKGVHSSLDLAYEKAEKAEEKINFLAALAQELEQMVCFPYLATAGNVLLRKRLTQYLNSYYLTACAYTNILVFPGSREWIDNVLSIYQPSVVLTDRTNARFFNNYNQPNKLLVGPSSSNELCELIEKTQPQIVIVGLSESQSKISVATENLITVCANNNARLFLDISESLSLSSSPELIGALNVIAESGIPPHVSLFCNFTKNNIYSELHIGFMLSKNGDLLDKLTKSAEFNYSRVPYLSSLYYSEILFDLLKFQMANVREQHIIGMVKDVKECVQTPKNVEQAFEHPSIKGNDFPITQSTIRLDYGENELAAPKELKSAIFESFARQIFTTEELNPKPEITAILKQRFGIENINEQQIILSNGVAPAFAALIRICKSKNKTLLIPTGAYGYFLGALDFYNVPYKVIATEEVNSFKLTDSSIQKAAEGLKAPWLFFNFPLVNPTGAYYSQSELDSIVGISKKLNISLLIDTVFSGLEFKSVKSFFIDYKELNINILGGLSKEFASGGIRFGFLYSNSEIVHQKLIEFNVVPPHKTVNYAIKKLYANLLLEAPSLTNNLIEQRKLLKERFIQLKSNLIRNGWEVLEAKGGLFMIAKPTAYIGKKIEVNGKIQTLNAANISEALFYRAELLINNDKWTGIEGYCRLVLSVEESTFERALLALDKFKTLVL